ncbi:MAG: MFS transporter [Deltaproteobacteria bacterium]|nr:MFS transporter [Deltaproteobacteria bacterium]
MAIYLLALICTLNHIGYSGSRVVVSLYALGLGANQFQIGVLMALYALFPLLLAIHIGKLADRVGPRLPMLAGTAGVAVALLLPPLLPGLLTLYGTAILIGASFNLFFITLMGIAGGIGGEINRGRNYALISLGFAAAGFFGPITAGFSIDHLGHLPAFLLLSTFTLVPIVLIAFRPGFLPPAAKPDAARGKRHAFDLWQVPTLRNTFIASGIISMAWDLFQFYMPVYGHAIGLSASVIGLVLGAFAAAIFLIRTVLPFLIRQSSEAEILSYGIFVAAAAFALFPFFKNVYALSAVAFLLGLGCGCGQPMSMSLIYALSPPGRAAESAGLRVMVNNIGSLAMPILFGGIGTAFGYFPVFFLNFVVLVAGGILFRRNVASQAGA